MHIGRYILQLGGIQCSFISIGIHVQVAKKEAMLKKKHEAEAREATTQEANEYILQKATDIVECDGVATPEPPPFVDETVSVANSKRHSPGFSMPTTPLSHSVPPFRQPSMARSFSEPVSYEPESYFNPMPYPPIYPSRSVTPSSDTEV